MFQRAFLLLAAAVCLTAIGCHHNPYCGGPNCASCGGHGCGEYACADGSCPDGAHLGPHGGMAAQGPRWQHKPLHGGPAPPLYGQPGPPTGQVTYPYYTVRGPRDFLLDNPPSIGN